MPMTLPEGAPATLGEAFARINAVTAPTVLDLKVMVLVEAAGQTLYDASAEGTDHPEVKRLLTENGIEEMKHAHRVSQAIKAISGEDFLPPSRADNPYLQGDFPKAKLTPEGLRGTAKSEFGGEALYGHWADSTENAEAAALFRLNGREETEHGDRLMQAAALLEA
ncbi:MAG TPA: ferritin-like domain-containing protein [Chakrabartia sp.]|jgi:rubrerythrin|nr:ferritin-like domain-containing protein [Chakrabartia sp.]